MNSKHPLFRRRKIKSRSRFLLVTLALVLGTSLAGPPQVAGTHHVPSIHPNETRKPTFGTGIPQPTDFGGGEYVLAKQGPALTERQRQSVQTEIQANVRRLQLPAPNQPHKVTLAWPLRPAPDLDDYGYHGISGFVDHDPAYPDHLLDYNCGDRTYDTNSGYNHAGTDFFTWPFSWNKMDHDEVQVVAAADGLIVYKQDGYYDRNCGFGQGDANLVAVLHGDGSTTWYLHLKRGSLTSKTIGTAVVQGEYLGVVGSSGNSTGPHLHFEVYDGLGHLIDPYQGACNSLNPDSWWDAQRPYYDPAVNKLSTGSAPPVFPACPEPEISHERTVFFPGETIYFTTYYRDQLAGLTSQYAIYEPDDSVYHNWSHSMNEDHFAASYWYWSFILGSAALTGTWRFEVTFDGQTYSRDFKVLEPSHLVYLPIVTR